MLPYIGIAIGLLLVGTLVLLDRAIRHNQRLQQANAERISALCARLDALSTPLPKSNPRRPFSIPEGAVQEPPQRAPFLPTYHYSSTTIRRNGQVLQGESNARKAIDEMMVSVQKILDDAQKAASSISHQPSKPSSKDNGTEPGEVLAAATGCFRGMPWIPSSRSL